MFDECLEGNYRSLVMSKNKSVIKKAPRLPGESVTFSVRITAGELERVQKLADQCGFSTNQFFVQSALGSCDMIEAAKDKPIPSPKLVATARYLRYERPTLIIS